MRHWKPVADQATAHCLQLMMTRMRMQQDWSSRGCRSRAGDGGQWSYLALCDRLEAKVWELEAHMAVALQGIRPAGPWVSAGDKIIVI